MEAEEQYGGSGGELGEREREVGAEVVVGVDASEAVLWDLLARVEHQATPACSTPTPATKLATASNQAAGIPGCRNPSRRPCHGGRTP